MAYVLTPEQIKKSKLSLTLIGINVSIYIVVNLILGLVFLFNLAQVNHLVVNQGEYWRLFTAMFVHADFGHLFNNMIAILFLGAATEENCTKLEYLVIYLVSGLIGNLFTLWLTSPASISLGASGAISGLMGVILIIIDRKTPYMKIYTILYIFSFFVSAFAPGIGTWAHIFGLFGGLGFGLLLKKKKMRANQNQ